MRGLLGVLIAACVCIGSSRAAGAEDYPTRPITMIVPFPAGGATDTLARFFSERMRTILRQPLIIKNIAGAAGLSASPARSVHRLTAIRSRSAPRLRMS